VEEEVAVFREDEDEGVEEVEIHLLPERMEEEYFEAVHRVE
jgi:hypothetical protein